MEMMLGELGVTAKTNLVKVQGLFNAIDNDGSGDIDGDELTRAHPSSSVFVTDDNTAQQWLGNDVSRFVTMWHQV